MKYKLKFINLTISFITLLITLVIVEVFLTIIEKKNSIQRSYISKFEFIKNYKNINREKFFLLLIQILVLKIINLFHWVIFHFQK